MEGWVPGPARRGFGTHAFLAARLICRVVLSSFLKLSQQQLLLKITSWCAFLRCPVTEKQELLRLLEKARIVVNDLWDAFPESFCSPPLWGRLSGS